MGQEPPSFPELLAKLRQGDDAAAARIFDRFACRLISLSRQRLDRRLRGKVDAEDIVQSVFVTVFRRLREGEFEIDGWDSLWGLLTCVTVRKCCKWIDHFGARGRDAAREVPLDGYSIPQRGLELFDREPSPAEAVALEDLVEQALRDLKPHEREIVALRLQGDKVPEIATHVGCSESKVNRVLRHVRQRLQRLRDGEVDPAHTSRSNHTPCSS